MKTKASKDKGRAAEGNRQRFDRLCVNRALFHIRIIVIGSLLNLLGRNKFIFAVYSVQIVQMRKNNHSLLEQRH